MSSLQSMELAQRGVYIGRERVRQFLFEVFGDEGPVQGRLGNHIHMQPVIHIDEGGDSGKVRSRMIQQPSFGFGPSMGAAIYETSWSGRTASGNSCPPMPSIPGQRATRAAG